MKNSIGIDLVKNSRFNVLAEKNINRFLTANELNEYNKLTDLYKPIYLAGRWAAKEAIYKAVNGFINMNLIKIEILYGDNKKPYCSNIKNISVSISHTEEHTVAIAIYSY